jgi:hypothetical protein
MERYSFFKGLQPMQCDISDTIIHKFDLYRYRRRAITARITLAVPTTHYLTCPNPQGIIGRINAIVLRLALCSHTKFSSTINQNKLNLELSQTLVC